MYVQSIKFIDCMHVCTVCSLKCHRVSAWRKRKLTGHFTSFRSLKTRRRFTMPTLTPLQFQRISACIRLSRIRLIPSYSQDPSRLNRCRIFRSCELCKTYEKAVPILLPICLIFKASEVIFWLTSYVNYYIQWYHVRGHISDECCVDVVVFKC